MKKLLFLLFLPSFIFADFSITNPRTTILPLPSGDANYIQNTETLQSNTTFYVSSGSVTALTVGTINGLVPGVLSSGSTNYIQNTSSLQSGAVSYTSSGTVDQTFYVTGTGKTGSTQVFGVKGSSLTVLANGNVGVGVVNPGALLDVGGGGSVSNGNLFHIGGNVTVGPSYAVYDSAPGITATQNGSAFDFQLAGNINPTSSGTHPLFSFLQISPAMTTDVGATVTNAAVIDVGSLTAYSHVTTATGIRVAAPTGATNNYAAQFTGKSLFTGHIITNGTGPSISACGSTPNGSLTSGDDNQGTVLIGGGVPVACTLTFASSWGVAPVCISESNTSVVTDGIGSISATAVTFNFSAASGNGTFWYRCGCSGSGCL